MILALLLSQATPDAATTTLPRDVRRFAGRAADCLHWRGEEPYDANRAREIAAAVRRACSGLRPAYRQLRVRYRRRPAILRRLADHAADMG